MTTSQLALSLEDSRRVTSHVSSDVILKGQKRSITSFVLVVCYLWLPDKQPFCDVIQLYFSSPRCFFSEVMYFNNRISHVLYREAHEMYTLFFISNLTTQIGLKSFFCTIFMSKKVSYQFLRKQYNKSVGRGRSKFLKWGDFVS